MITARLVAPGAMSPISMLPSFKTMWCVTVSLFLNMTCCPPKFAGLGVNACFPFWPTIVIVDAAAAADGAVVLDDPLPPPLQPNAAARPNASTEAFHTLSRIHQSFRAVTRGAVVRAPHIPASVARNQRVDAVAPYSGRKAFTRI